MDFENIYKSRSIILEMLKTRNCDVSGYEAQTKDELNKIIVELKNTF